LFSAILRRAEHVRHPLLPPLKTTVYHLPKRSHDLELSAVKSSFFEEKFGLPECCTLTFIMPRPRVGALSDDARLTSVCRVDRA